jgi:hypothetical protein
MGLFKTVIGLTAAGAILVVPVAAMAETTRAPVAGLSHASLNPSPVSLAGARTGAKRQSESKILGLPLLLVAAVGVAATVAVAVAVSNNNSTSP